MKAIDIQVGVLRVVAEKMLATLKAAEPRWDDLIDDDPFLGEPLKALYESH